MLEVKIDNEANPPTAAFFREGKYKCLIDYNHLRRCLLNEDPDIARTVVGSLMYVLEDGFTNKLDKSELKELEEFLGIVKNTQRKENK